MRASPAASRRSAAAGLVAMLLYACGSDEPPEPPASMQLQTQTQTQTQPQSHSGTALVLHTNLAPERVAGLSDAYRRAAGHRLEIESMTDAALVAGLAAHAADGSADVLLIEGIGTLAATLEEDGLRPGRVATDTGTAADPEGYWYSLAAVPDLIVIAGGEPPANYAALASERYRDGLCLRRGTNPRSLALLGFLILQAGEREAELTVRGWRRNLAQPVYDTESDALAAVADGHCRATIAGADRITTFLAARPDAPIDVIVPEAAITHPIAIGVARHANDAETAAEFVAWLLRADTASALPLVPDLGGIPGPPGGWDATTAAAIALRYEDAGLLAERARYR